MSGVPTCVEHTCGCNEKVGILGTHGLKCKKSRFSRHHAVNDIIARALNLANFPSMLVAGQDRQSEGRLALRPLDRL